MQRLRIRYAKRGRLRFTSHRDVARAFERALRRADVPMAFSQGFSPHPRVSWVGAAPTGVASEAEYVEIQVVRPLDPARLRIELDTALPPGLDILEVLTAAPGSLPERIEASSWRIELPGVPPGELAAAAAALLAAERAEVQRLTKDGKRTIDVREALVSAEIITDTSDAPKVLEPAEPGAAPECGILEVVVRQLTPTVRPDDVLSALYVVADLSPLVPAKATRMAQGRLDEDGRLTDPLAPEKAAADAAVAGEQEQRSAVVARPVG